MKKKEELEKIQEEMINQIPDIMVKVGECEDETNGLSAIAAFVARLAMVTYILEDKNTPYPIVEAAVTEAFDKAVDRITPAELEEAILRRRY